MCLTNSCWNYCKHSTWSLNIETLRLLEENMIHDTPQKKTRKACYKCRQDGNGLVCYVAMQWFGQREWVPNAAFCPVRLDKCYFPGAHPFPRHVRKWTRNWLVGTPCTLALWGTTVPLLARHGGIGKAFLWKVQSRYDIPGQTSCWSCKRGKSCKDQLLVNIDWFLSDKTTW